MTPTGYEQALLIRRADFFRKATMSILDENGNLFSLLIRERGMQYYKKKKVIIYYENETFVMAEVQGSETYCVDIELKDAVLGAACTCPYAKDRSEEASCRERV